MRRGQRSSARNMRISYKIVHYAPPRSKFVIHRMQKAILPLLDFGVDRLE